MSYNLQNHYELKGNKKILVITDAITYSGIGRYAYFLSKSLDANLVSLRKDRSQDRSLFNGTIYDGTFSPFLSKGWFINQFFPSLFMRNYLNFLRMESIDGSIIHYANPSIEPIKNVSNSVVTIHDLIAIKLKNNYDWLFERAVIKSLKRFKNFENIVTVSIYVAKQLKNEGFSGRIEAIYPPISENFRPLGNKIELRKKLGLPLNKKLILSVSSDESRKNLKAVKETVEKLGPEYILVRVGNGLGNSINYKNVNDELLNEIFNASDALLFPSIEEGFGFPVAEAMSVGLPVVCSDIEVFREIGKDSLFFSEISSDKLALSIKEALNSSDDAIKKGLEISKEYRFNTFKTKIRDYYKRTFGYEAK